LNGGFLARLRGTQRQTSDPPRSSQWAHAIAHRLHWQRGVVVSAYDSAGNLWIGYRCLTCGKVGSAEPDDFRDGAHRPPDSAFQV
jgi:hypothetical protein